MRNMKKVFKNLILVFVIGGFTTLILFFFYAKSPNWNSNDYYELLAYESQFAPEKDTLIVCSYNLGYLSGMTNNMPIESEKKLYDDNLDRAIGFLSSVDADLLALQEVDFHSDRSYHVDQLDFLAKSLKYTQGYRSVNWDKKYLPFPYWPIRRHFGNIVSGQAIVSKYELKNPETIILTKPVDASFFYNEFYLDRLVQLVDCKIGGRVIRVMNVHLEAFHIGTRVEQAKVVKELFDQYSDMPIILLGDFNSTPEYEKENGEALAIIMESKDIESVISKEDYLNNPAEYFTYSSKSPTLMIDHILYNSKFMTSTDAHVGHSAANISDHLPLVAKLIFR